MSIIKGCFCAVLQYKGFVTVIFDAPRLLWLLVSWLFSTLLKSLALGDLSEFLPCTEYILHQLCHLSHFRFYSSLSSNFS